MLVAWAYSLAMFATSEEKMFAADGHRLKVPHMGWNHVQQAQHLCGQILTKGLVSILFIVIVSSRVTQAWSWELRITGFPLPVRLGGIISCSPVSP